MSPPVCARCIYLSLACVCLPLAGVTFGHAVSVVVFLVELNNPFCPRLNGCNGLGMCLQAFLVFLGSGPDCVTGPVIRTDRDVYRRLHSHMMCSLLHAFVVMQTRVFHIRVQYLLMAHGVTHLQFQMLIIYASFSPSIQSNKVPVVQHAHHVHPLTPLITYSNEHFSPGTPPSHLSPEILDPKTGNASSTHLGAL